MTGWHRNSRVATAALLALVVLDVVLVAAALRPTGSSGVAASSASSAFASIEPTGAPVSPSPTPSAPPAAASPLRTMIVALDTQHAWRVGAGSCSAGGAALATTADGGKTWVQAKASFRRIVRVRPTSAKAAFIVGADTSCTAGLMNTADGGGTWVAGGAATGAWLRDPRSSLVVRAPGSATSQPCGKRIVLDLAVVAAGSSRVLCAGGLVRSTADSGSTWTDLGTVVGAVALSVPTPTPAQTYVASLGARGCPGVQIMRVGQQVATACIPTPIPAGPGQIALSLIKGGGWLAIGNVTMRSTDGLLTWTAS